MKKIRNKLIVIVILLLTIITIISFLLIDNKNDNEIIEDNSSNANITITEINDQKEDNIDNEYNENKSINDDYIGKIVFESGIINLPIVQAKGELNDYIFYAYQGQLVEDYENDCEGVYCNLNDVYLRKHWRTGDYDLGGSIFMDYRNNLDDPNLIIYGHLYPKSMDINRELFFSSLDLLLEKSNYEDNCKFKLEFKNEIREYQVALVYLFDTNSDDDYENLQYYLTNYEYDYDGNPNHDYHQIYLENINKAKLYETNVDIDVNDNLVTLQTCVDGSNNLVEIVVAKEINRY